MHVVAVRDPVPCEAVDVGRRQELPITQLDGVLRAPRQGTQELAKARDETACIPHVRRAERRELEQKGPGTLPEPFNHRFDDRARGVLGIEKMLYRGCNGTGSRKLCDRRREYEVRLDHEAEVGRRLRGIAGELGCRDGRVVRSVEADRPQQGMAGVRRESDPREALFALPLGVDESGPARK